MAMVSAGALLGGWLWAIFTIVAAAAQTARNAMQRDLIDTIGTAGATYVRFLFALPFTAVFILVLMFVLAIPFPRFGLAAIAWTVAGAATQIVATALMLAGMRQRSFSVIITYTNTEPMIIAMLGAALLGDVPNLTVVAAILVATAGVMLISWSKADGAAARDWRPAVLGLSSGLFFALSAISYRGALLTLDTSGVVMAAAATQLIGQAMQSAAILGWLGARDRPLLAAIGRAWRRSLFAGFMGAAATLFWFMAFALASAAKVRTLALVEVPMAMVVSRRVFRQGASRAEFVGMTLIVAGLVLLLNG